MLHVLRLTIVLLISAIPAAADELEKRVQRTMEQARKNAARIVIPINKHQDEAMKAALESAGVFSSPEYQEKLRYEQKQLKEEVFTESNQGYEADELLPGKLAQDEKLYLFLSSSIPEDTIHNYLEAVEKANDPNIILLMKGYVPGERTRYLIRITKKDPNCVDRLQREKPLVCERFESSIKIKPSLFDRFEINRVPALCYEKDKETWKITGDAALVFLLERINREAKSPGLKALVTVLRGAENE